MIAAMAQWKAVTYVYGQIISWAFTSTTSPLKVGVLNCLGQPQRSTISTVMACDVAVNDFHSTQGHHAVVVLHVQAVSFGLMLGSTISLLEPSLTLAPCTISSPPALCLASQASSCSTSTFVNRCVTSPPARTTVSCRLR